MVWSFFQSILHRSIYLGRRASPMDVATDGPSEIHAVCRQVLVANEERRMGGEVPALHCSASTGSTSKQNDAMGLSCLQSCQLHSRWRGNADRADFDCCCLSVFVDFTKTASRSTSISIKDKYTDCKSLPIHLHTSWNRGNALLYGWHASVYRGIL